MAAEITGRSIALKHKPVADEAIVGSSAIKCGKTHFYGRAERLGECRGTRGRDVTSTTPGRILKGRDRNVHESIPAAVRPVASEVRSLE
jgi:hypothetical protein